MAKKGHVDPTFNFNKKKKKNQKLLKSVHGQRGSNQGERFFNFSILNLLSSIHGVPTVGFRRAKHKKCSTRRGLRVRTKNTGFHREFW